MGVSFHPETGSQHLAFHSQERSSAASTSTPRGSTGINRDKEALAFARTSSCTSKTVSRVLYQTVIYLDVPSPVRSATPGAAGPALRVGPPAPIPVLLRIEFTASDSLQPMGELLPRLSTLTDRAISLSVKACRSPRERRGGLIAIRKRDPSSLFTQHPAPFRAEAIALFGKFPSPRSRGHRVQPSLVP